MAAAVSKAGPYYSSGPISFSSLRQNFRAQTRKVASSASETFDSNDIGPISALSLRRNITTTDTNPIVPDSTENRTCGPLGLGITTGNNLAISQFRNSIKYYYITQSGTETFFDIDTPPSPGTWNNNLSKNIHKIIFIDGECGSNIAASPASSFDATAYNMTIDVHGNIYGSGGRGGGTGGGAPDPAGEDGGTALTIASSGGNNIVVEVRSTGKIYGGGGGGERGKVGNNGQPGTCNESYTASNCGGCPGCAGGWTEGGCWSGGGCNRRQECNWWGNCWWVDSQWNHYRTCSRTYSIAGGNGGAGGLGGPGRGYANQSGSLLGQSGSPGAGDNGCGSTGGIQGDTGGAGGEWANDGENTLNTAAGGNKGKAITGTNYSVQGVINSLTVKGQYLASI